MTLKSRLWNWDVGFDAAKKAWGGWSNPWREYLDNLRSAKEAEASTLSRNELEGEFVALSIIMAKLLSEANKVQDHSTNLSREYDNFAERMFPRIKGVSQGGDTKAANDTKMQAAKKNALRIWEERKAGRWPKLRVDADFYNHIMDTYGAPKNADTVRRWVHK
jgi:hypothetical protein